MTAAGVFVAVVAVRQLWPEDGAEPVPWSDLSAAVGPLTLVRETKLLFRSDGQLKAYFQEHEAEGRTPRVDFRRRQLLLISPGPRSSSGYRLEIVRIRRDGDRIAVAVRERTPALGERVAARVTFPYRLLSLPRDADVYVDWLGR